jgi:hypothetical protein
VKLQRATLILIALSALACGLWQPGARSEAQRTTMAGLPLTGTVLLQHKQQMRRALESLFVFRLSLASLAVRRESRDQEVFADFVEAYMGMHLDRLVHGDWQSGHPELTALNANLRILKADLLIRMRERARAEAALDEIAERFRGNEGMLIEYPPGQQTSVRRALDLLRQKRWWTL